MEILGYTLKETCSACPEQYEVFKDDKQVGYLRLRHGYFYASVPDCSDNLVYEAYPEGDGMFNSDEREKYLYEAVRAIAVSRSEVFAPEINSREKVLLRAVYDLLTRCAESGYAQDAMGVLVHYDRADCDGFCLRNEIAEILGIDENTKPIALKGY